MHHCTPPSNNWVAQFERGDFSTCFAACSGRPKKVTTPEIIDQIYESMFEDRRISAKSIAEQLDISRERVGSIINENLDMRKLPKCLNVHKKRQMCQLSEQIWNFFGAIQMISCRNWWTWTEPDYVNMTRRQSNNQWNGGMVAHPALKNSEFQKSAWKVLASIFLDQDGILLIDYLPKGPTINAEYYSSLLVQLKGFLKEKRRGKFTTGSCSSEGTGLPGLPKSWLPTLFPGSGPVGLPPVPWTEKIIDSWPFFVRSGGHCCRGDLVGQTNFWFFFWVACKSYGLRSILSFVGSVLNKFRVWWL